MTSKRCFALLGPPASGKGTQGRLLTERLGIAYLSTGAQLRREIEKGTALGLRAKVFLDANQYVPDSLAIELVQDWVGDHSNGWLLDGFPRSIPQAEAFCEASLISATDQGAFPQATERESELVIIHLSVPMEELRVRVSTRRECRSCGASTTSAHQVCPKCGSSELEARADDSSEGFEKRLQAYQTLTIPALEFLQQRTQVITINGSGSREEVAAAIAHQIT